MILVAILAILFWPSPVTRAPKTHTQSNLKIVYYTMAVLEDESHKTMAELLGEISTGALAREKWKTLVARTEVKEGIESGMYEKSLCYDGYGRLLNVEYKTNLTALRMALSLTNSEFDVVIWSSGYNGTNEYGNGDDIVLPPDARLK